MRVQRLNKNRVLGSLCERGHTFAHETPDGHGIPIVRAIVKQSVRYKGCGTCCTCNALSVLDRKVELGRYRDSHKGKMSKYQKKYRKDKKRKNEKKYQDNYYLTVTKSKRKRDRHNKKLLKGMNHS